MSAYILKGTCFGRFLLCVLLCLATSVSSGAFIVVLDAGHGGKDPGALGTYSKEKNINLNVVLRLGKLIKENCRDVTIIYTRQTDKFVELYERAEIANNAKADLFISVHTNSTGNNSTTGTETYSLTLEKAATNLEVVKRENSVIQYEENRQRYSSNSLENKIMSEVIMGSNMRTSAIFAKSVQDEYRRVGRPSRGVHQQNFHVLRQVAMPSVLTELGFISTPSEEAYLNSERGINELATCIFNAFRKHISPILSGMDASANADPAVEEKVVEPTPQPEERKEVNNEPATPEKPVQQVVAQHQENRRQVAENPKKEQTPVVQPVAKKQGDSKYEFRVQICTSDRQLHSESEQFKGLKNVQTYTVNLPNGKRQFVHTYGSSRSYAEIRGVKDKVKQKFNDCFIVVFKDGKRITGEEASTALRKQP